MDNTLLKPLVVIVRYLFLLAVALGSAVIFAGISIAFVELVLQNTDPITLKLVDRGHLAMAGLVLAGLVGCIRFAFRDVPVVVGGWLNRYRDQLVTMVLGLLVCAVFVMT